MGTKMVNDLVLDAALEYIRDNATQISVCIDTPTTYNESVTVDNKMMALHTLTTADMTIGNGATGRMLTVAAQAAITVTSSGTQNATHVCLAAAAANLLYVTTCTSQALVNANTVTIPAWTITIADPTP
jgi:hypothetical protein